MMKLLISELALLKKEQQDCNNKLKTVLEERKTIKKENESIKKENKNKGRGSNFTHKINI